MVGGHCVGGRPGARTLGPHLKPGTVPRKTNPVCVYYRVLACSEVDDEIKNEKRVWDTIEDDPARTEVIIEKRDGNWQYNEIDE